MITGKCPICKRPAEAEFKPFCSRRCADLDLQRWLSGSYAIPAGEDDGVPAPMQVPDEE